MPTGTRILERRSDWTDADHDALSVLYGARGEPAPGDLAGLLDWAGCSDVDLVCIAIEGSGGFDAAILLTRRRVAGVWTIRLAGHGWADEQVVPARSRASAARLAAAVADWLSGLRRWRLDLEQLPLNDPFVEALGGLCPVAALDSGDPLPYLDRPETRTPTNWAPKKFRQQSRQAHRRLTEERGEPRICVIGTTDRILDRLGCYHSVFHAREQELGRPSALRDSGIAATKQRVLRRLGDQGLLQAWELRVGEELIAYYITVQVGTTRRIWDGRMAPGLAHVSPGTVLMAHVLQEWHRDPCIQRVDFMRGGNEFKRRLSNGQIETRRLRAWSSPRLAATDTSLAALEDHGRRLVRGARDRSPTVARVIRWLRLPDLPGTDQPRYVRQGPRIAKTCPGSCTFPKSTVPSGEKVGPVISL